LGEDHINVTIDAKPKVLVGKKRARGLTAAMQAVADDHEALLREWHATRPNDQRLENFKAKKAEAAAKAKSGITGKTQSKGKSESKSKSKSKSKKGAKR
jgi:hypothetical protein